MRPQEPPELLFENFARQTRHLHYRRVTACCLDDRMAAHRSAAVDERTHRSIRAEDAVGRAIVRVEEKVLVGGQGVEASCSQPYLNH